MSSFSEGKQGKQKEETDNSSVQCSVQCVVTQSCPFPRLMSVSRIFPRVLSDSRLPSSWASSVILTINGRSKLAFDAKWLVSRAAVDHIRRKERMTWRLTWGVTTLREQDVILINTFFRFLVLSITTSFKRSGIKGSRGSKGPAWV